MLKTHFIQSSIPPFTDFTLPLFTLQPLKILYSFFLSRLLMEATSRFFKSCSHMGRPGVYPHRDSSKCDTSGASSDDL